MRALYDASLGSWFSPVASPEGWFDQEIGPSATPPPVSGSGALTFSAAAVDAGGTETFAGIGGEAFQAAALAGTAILEVAGTGTIAIDASAIDGSALEVLGGTGDLQFGSADLAGAAIEAFTSAGDVSTSGPAFAAIGAVSQDLTGSGEIAFAGPELDAAGMIPIDGEGAVLIDVPGLDGLAFNSSAPSAEPVPFQPRRQRTITAVSGRATLAIARPEIAGLANVEIHGVGAIQNRAPSLRAAGQLRLTATGTVMAEPPAIAASAHNNPFARAQREQRDEAWILGMDEDEAAA